MSVTYATGRNLASKSIPAANSSVYVPYERPSDWLELPTVGPTDQKFAGLIAVFDNDSNYVSLTASHSSTLSFSGNIGNGSNTGAGNIMSATQSPQPAVTVGMYLSNGTLPDGSLTVTAINTATFTATASGTTLTVTAMSSGTISRGMVINGYPVFISAFGTGTGGTGTYTLSGTATGSITSAQSFTVSASTPFISNTTIIASDGLQVDWGDGNVETFASGASRVWHQYDYAAISDTTISTLGYKQAIVTVTPPAGKNLLTFSLQTSVPVSNIITPSINWLDIIFGSPYLNGVSIGGNSLTNLFPMLEKSTWVSKASGYQPGQLYRNCWALQEPIFSESLNDFTGTSFWFGQCFKLRNAPELNLSNVTSMTGMFNLCYNLQYIPQYDTRKVTDMSTTFQGCTNLTSIPLFNTSNVTNFSQAFDSCRLLENIPYFNTYNATNMSSMFATCVSLKTIPQFDTSKVTTMASMFTGCANLKTIPFLNTSNVTTTYAMFSNCSSLETIPLIDTSKSTNTSTMFAFCSSLMSVPTLNTSNVANMQAMFNTCLSLPAVPTFNTGSSLNFNSMFNSCASLRGDIVIDRSTSIGNPNVSSMLAGATLVNSLTVSLPSGSSTNTTLSSTLNNARSIKSVNLGNCAGVTTTTSFVSSTNSLASLRVPNIPISISVGQTLLSKDALEILFYDLAPNATSQTVTISATPGATTPVTSTMVAGSSAGTFTIQVANTASFQEGMYVTNSVCFADSSVTYSNTNWTFTKTAHGLLNGEMVSFTGATFPTGITRYGIYYVVNRTSSTFQVSLTPGGSVVSFSTSGTTTMRNVFKINSIVDSTTMVLNAPITATTTATALSGRMLNTYIATLKNWTVTG